MMEEQFVKTQEAWYSKKTLINITRQQLYMLRMGEEWQWVGIGCKKKVEIIKHKTGDWKKKKGQILKDLLVKLISDWC